MERRSFFALLAAPFIRRLSPVEPIGSIIVDGRGFAVGYRKHDGMLMLLNELGVEDEQSVLDAMYPESA